MSSKSRPVRGGFVTVHNFERRWLISGNMTLKNDWPGFWRNWVSITEVLTSCALAPSIEREPPKILRITTCLRMARSAFCSRCCCRSGAAPNRTSLPDTGSYWKNPAPCGRYPSEWLLLPSLIFGGLCCIIKNNDKEIIWRYFLTSKNISCWHNDREFVPLLAVIFALREKN